MAFTGKDVSKEKRTGWTFRGREILLTKRRGHPLGGIEKKKGWYPEEKKLEADALYAMTGDVHKVEELSGVTAYALRQWVKQPWFQDVLTEIRQENNERLDAKLTEVIQRSQDLILERLENGDWKTTKDGDLYRIPVNIRDLTLVGAISVDKRQIVRNKPTSITASVGGEGKTLEKLAEAFIALANKKEISFNPIEEPIDVEFQEVSCGDGGADIPTEQAPTEDQEPEVKTGT